MALTAREYFYGKFVVELIIIVGKFVYQMDVHVWS